MCARDMGTDWGWRFSTQKCSVCTGGVWKAAGECAGNAVREVHSVCIRTPRDQTM